MVQSSKFVERKRRQADSQSLHPRLLRTPLEAVLYQARAGVTISRSLLWDGSRASPRPASLGTPKMSGNRQI